MILKRIKQELPQVHDTRFPPILHFPRNGHQTNMGYNITELELLFLCTVLSMPSTNVPSFN